MICLVCKQPNLNTYDFGSLWKTQKEQLCVLCLKKLIPAKGGCLNCCKKTEASICLDCLYWRNNKETKHLHIKNHSLYYYNDFAKKIIHTIKFNGHCQILDIFIPFVKSYFKRHFSKKEYELVIVPIHKTRLEERGFNQSLYIASMLPHKKHDILLKINDDKQSKKSRMERIGLNQSFRLKEYVNLKEKKLIIIDDIYTTGATIYNIANYLSIFEDVDISSFTLFRS